MEILVKVNKTNIRNGWPEDGENCPIAQRLLSMGFPWVDVNGALIAFAPSWEDATRGVMATTDTPEPAQRFIESFDLQAQSSVFPVEPMSFVLDVPEEAMAWRRRRSR